MAEIIYKLLKALAGLSLILLSVLMIILLIKQKPEWSLFYIITTTVVSVLSLLFITYAFMLFKQSIYKSSIGMKGILDEGEIKKDEEIDGSTI